MTLDELIAHADATNSGSWKLLVPNSAYGDNRFTVIESTSYLTVAENLLLNNARLITAANPETVKQLCGDLQKAISGLEKIANFGDRGSMEIASKLLTELRTHWCEKENA